jgi:hypothetical protein
MKTKIQVAFAVIVILAAGYWAFATTRSYQYSGTNIMFPVGAGHAIVTNTGSEPMEIEMRSGERVANFRVASDELGMNQSSKRQGTGRGAFHNVLFDIPPGQTRVDVVSGRDVRMIARGETRIEATVVPVAAGTIRWVLILSGGVSVWALYYMSSATNHRWVKSLRNRSSSGSLQPEQTTT